MNTSIRTRIIKIGNSQGIRIPRLLLEQSGLHDEVELVLDEEQLVIRPIPNPRRGWDEQFRLMAEQEDDALLDPETMPSLTTWDEEEWTW
jgi:antitoxin MazE